MKRKIKVRVPVVAKGKSIGVENGGILQIVRRELEVLCLPLEIPESFEIDTTELDIGDSVHLDEISLEKNVEFPEDVNFTILTIVSPKAVEEEVEEELEEELEEGEEGEEGAAKDEETEEKPEK
jgi:large subunit ribosomal protein L25